VFAYCADDLPAPVAEMLSDRFLETGVAKGGRWQVLPGVIVSAAWADTLRGAMGAASDKARQVVSRVKVTGRDRILLVSIVAESASGQQWIPGPDGPEVQVMEPGGRRHDDLGFEMAGMCMLTLTDVMAGGNAKLPAPMDPHVYRAFLVPQEARGLELVVKGSRRGVPLPDPVDLDGIDQQPFRPWSEIAWSELPAEDAASVGRSVLSQFAFVRGLGSRITALPAPADGESDAGKAP
jgi:hypothetical protein